MGKTGEAECCMCGDHGLSSELFSCNVCGFRSQHKYCSNLYPGAESYHICNWCLSQKEQKRGEEIAKSSQISSHKSDHQKVKIKKSKIDTGVRNRRTIEKQPKSEPPPPSAGRKRVTSDRGSGVPEKRKKSEEKVNSRPVFRNKVRRYKLLDEVSS